METVRLLTMYVAGVGTGFACAALLAVRYHLRRVEESLNQLADRFTPRDRDRD